MRRDPGKKSQDTKEEQGDAFPDGLSVVLGALLSVLICLMFNLVMA